MFISIGRLKSRKFVVPVLASVMLLSSFSILPVFEDKVLASTNTVDVRVASDSDDAEETISTGSMYLDSSDLELIYDSGSAVNQVVGMRFNNINIPNGATISNAHVQFTTGEVSTGSVNLTVKAQDVDNASTFTSSAYNISSRSLTSAQVSWSPAEWNTVGEASSNQKTPDIKNVIQEVVNRSGWSNGNSIALIISGNSGNRRCAESYKGSSTKAPLLHIEYTGETPPPPPPISSYNVYYGHLHNHSNVSDGTGTPSQAYAYARDTAGLDFFALADHAESITSTEWTTIKNAANSYNQDGSFVALWGFEWSSSTKGHVAVINTTDYCTSSSSSTDTFPELVTWLSSRDGVAFFNHPGRQDSTGAEFSHFASTPSTKFVGMELWNKNDTFNTYYYNDGYYTSDGNKSYYDEAILRGWKIGAAGSSDNHSGTWGTDNDYRLAVLANSKTRASIYEALQAKRFFTTLDKNLALSFELNGSQMGSSISAGTYNAVIKASDANAETFTEVKLFKNGTAVYTWTPNAANPNITQSLTTASGDSYYVKVKQADGNEAISSPIFIQ